MNKKHFLFLTILMEGYVVLSSELLAIRLLMPYVGSGVEVIAIIISGILLPLAVGYHFGGMAFHNRFVRARTQGHRPPSPRNMLLQNLVLALVFLALGLTHIFLEFFFSGLSAIGITHRLAQTSLYAVLFLVTPTFLLGQTVPLISNYFSRRRLSEITGQMLFFSTTGSFLGSLCSTLILMSLFGVQFTVIVTLGLICLLCLFLGMRKQCPEVKWALLTMFFVLLFNCGLNSERVLPSQHIYSNNAYNMVQVFENDSERTKTMSVNRSASSQISADPEKRFEYIKYIDKNFIEPLKGTNAPPRDILVLGAGGFTIGQHDSINNYTFVDIDGDLKNVAEKYFLTEKLTPNKRFIPSSARTFLRNDESRYDLIVLDVYTMKYSIPVECVTQEFLQGVKDHLKSKGIVVANVIVSPTFGDKFAVRYHRTFTSVFPVLSRQILAGFNPWNENEENSAAPEYANILYIYFHNKLIDDAEIYTDDKSSYSLDQK